MIIQAWNSDGKGNYPIFWDNAIQVSTHRVNPDEYSQEDENTNYIGLVHAQRRHNYYDRHQKNNMVKQVNWVDRVTGLAYQVGSLDSIFVLTDQGKTLARV